MESNKIPTAEEFRSAQYQLLKYGYMLSKDAEIVEFAKLHVGACKKEMQFVQKMKYMTGETGYLKQEDFDLLYPLNNIK